MAYAASLSQKINWGAAGSVTRIALARRVRTSRLLPPRIRRLPARNTPEFFPGRTFEVYVNARGRTLRRVADAQVRAGAQYRGALIAWGLRPADLRQLRVAVDARGNTYAWNAFVADHFAVERALGTRFVWGETAYDRFDDTLSAMRREALVRRSEITARIVGRAPGRIWVAGYYRDGQWVRGYYRDA